VFSIELELNEAHTQFVYKIENNYVLNVFYCNIDPIRQTVTRLNIWPPVHRAKTATVIYK